MTRDATLSILVNSGAPSTFMAFDEFKITFSDE